MRLKRFRLGQVEGVCAKVLDPMPDWRADAAHGERIGRWVKNVLSRYRISSTSAAGRSGEAAYEIWIAERVERNMEDG